MAAAQKQTEYVRSVREAAISAYLPEDWEVCGQVDPEEIALCMEIVDTSAGTSLQSLICDGILIGTPPVTLRRKSGERLRGTYQQTVSDIFVGLTRDTVRVLAATGFVFYRAFDSTLRTLREPIIPSVEDCEYRMLRHKVSGKIELVIYMTNTKPPGYDLSCIPKVINMPDRSGKLKSRAASVIKEYRRYLNRDSAAQASDVRHTVPPLLVRYDDPNAGRPRQEFEAGVGTMSSIFLTSQQEASRNLRDLTAGDTWSSRMPGVPLPPAETIFESVFPAYETGFDRTVFKLRPNIEVVPLPAEDRTVISETEQYNRFRRALTTALDLPATLLEGDTTLTYGKAVDAIQRAINHGIKKWARMTQEALQRAYDTVYGQADVTNARALVTRVRTARDETVRLADELARLSALAGQRINVKAFIASSDELERIAFMSETEADEFATAQEVAVELTHQTYVSTEHLLRLLQAGLLTDDQARVIAIRAFGLEHDLLAAEDQLMRGGTRSTPDGYPQGGSDQAIALATKSTSSRKSRAARKNKSRNSTQRKGDPDSKDLAKEMAADNLDE